MIRGFFPRILVGFTLWAAAFLILYAAQATGCRLGWEDVPLAGPITLLRLILIGATLASLALLVLPLKTISDRREKSAARTFGRDVALLAGTGAVASFIITFSGIFWLSLC